MGELFAGALDRLASFDISVTDILDIAIVSYIIYKLLRYLRRTNSANVLKGILFLVVFLWLSNLLELNVVNFLLGKTVELGVLALVVLFQPEIRTALGRMGGGAVLGVFAAQKQDNVSDAITKTVRACEQMSMTRTGALIVFERSISLEDFCHSGTVLDAMPSTELIKNIFFHNSPLHDGALIIRDGRLVSAGCLLPNSQNTNISKELGTRHRAGVGISEQTDAVAVVISEETGSISVATDGMLKRHLSSQTLEQILINELQVNRNTSYKDKLITLKEKLNGKKNDN